MRRSPQLIGERQITKKNTPGGLAASRAGGMIFPGNGFPVSGSVITFGRRSEKLPVRSATLGTTLL